MADINIGAITESLNYKSDLDLGNVDSTGKSSTLSWIFPDYDNQQILTGYTTTNTTFTVPEDGWLRITLYGSNMMKMFYIDDKVENCFSNATNVVGYNPTMILIKKGSHTWRTSSLVSRVYAVTFIPFSK